MNILFVVDERKMGGVSIMLSDILKKMDYHQFNIDVLVLHNVGDKLNDLPNEVNIIYGTSFFRTVDSSFKEVLQSKQISSIINKIKMIFYMKTGLIKYFIKRERKKILTKKYDTEVAFKDGYCALIVGYGDAPNKVQWLHCDYLKKDHLANYKHLFKKLYNNFTKIVAISNPIKDGFNTIYGNKEKTISIYNLIDKDKIIKMANEFDVKMPKSLNFISVGRVHPTKGYLRLVEVVNKLKIDGLFNATLTLIGDGPEFNEVKNLIEKYNLQDDINLLGNQNNPFPYVKQADMFLMCSVYEAFGLTIVESLTLGTPVLSTEVATIRELLDEKNGLIVENSFEGLYNGLKSIIENSRQLKIYKTNLKEYTYPVDDIVKQIEEVLLDGEKKIKK